MTASFTMRKIAVFGFTVLCGKKALRLLKFGPVYTFKGERESEIVLGSLLLLNLKM